MKVFTRKTISLLLVLVLILNLAGVTFYADKTADFSVHLSSDQSVVANYNKVSKIISITGNGTIEFDKWVALAKKIDGANYPVKNNASATGGWQSSTANMTISFDNGKVSLCDSQNHSGLFENFKGQILFNHHVERSQVSNLSYLFKGASALKQIDITTSTSAAIVATANDLLTGTNPDIVKFDKLAAFSWQLPAAYEITKGDGKNKNTKTVTAGATVTFDADSAYQLNKVVAKNQVKGPQDANDFTKELAGGTADDSVLAYYDYSANLITISGKGTIQQDKWISMARAVKGGSSSYKKKCNPIPCRPFGWQNSVVIDMVFEPTASVQFEASGFNTFPHTGYGWFQDFKGTVAFNDAVDTANMTNMSNMFERTARFNDASIAHWNTSNVTTMFRMFHDAKEFNQALEANTNLGYWNVSSVTTMMEMFKGATAFNGSLKNWDTASCTSMQSMFEGTNFNQPVNHFDIRKVTSTCDMFRDAQNFNQPIDDWQEDSLNKVKGMFRGATSFNQDISTFDTGKVLMGKSGLEDMFLNATAMKNIDFSNRATSAEVVSGWGLLDGTTPDVVKFHKLSYFEWVLPAKYKVVKGEIGSQTSETVDQGINYAFTSDTRYALIREGTNYLANFPMQLASGAIGDSVIANYDLTTKQITISGEGTILEEKWKLLAREIKGDATPFTVVDGKKRGWQTTQDIHMVFDTSASVQFEANGFQYNSGHGWFQDFTGTIQFNDALNTSSMTDMSHMFERTELFNDSSVAQWDTSNVTNMGMMFNEAENFDQNLNNWTVSNVTTMDSMFRGAAAFNGSLSGWDTSNCRNMNSMFAYSKFNQPINHFDVRQVENMRFMFYKDYAFNQPLDSWQIDNLTAVYSMFSNATSFNQDISNFNTTKVLNSEDGLSAMFTNASAMKQINLSNRADNSEIVVATGLLDGTNPDTVKFDRLAEFTWQLPADYQIIKGDIGSQSTEIAIAGTDYSFAADTRYEVKKLPVEPNVSLNAFEKTYDGNAITVQYLIDNSVVNPENIAGNWQLDNSNLANVGSYTMNVTFKPDNSSHYNQKTLSVNFKINKKPLTLPALTIIKEWDGTTAATVSYDEAVIKAGVISGDSVNISPITGIYDTSEVGSGKNVALNGGALDNPNYSLVIPSSATGEIVKAMPTCAIEAQLNAVYGDTLSDVNVVGSGQGTWQFQQPLNSSVGVVGDHQQTMIFYPTDTAHYNTKTANTTLSVARKILLLTNPTVDDKAYDGTTTATLNYEALDGIVAGDASDVSVDTISATFDSSEAGSAKSVTVNSVTLKGAKSDNYSVVLPTGLTGEITKAKLGYVIPTGLSATYGDSLSSIMLPSDENGHFEFVEPNQQMNSVTDTIADVVYIPNDLNNYSQVTDQVTIKVTKKPLMLKKPSVETKAYDGTTTATLNYEALDGIVAGDASDVSVDTISATFDSSEAGSAKSVTVNSVTLKGAKSDNYSVVLPTGLTGEITKATPTFTVPTNLRLSYGGALKDIQLPDEARGNWQFETPDTRPSVIGANKYKLIYLPNNSNYESALLEVTVLIVGGTSDNDDDDADKNDEITNGNTALDETNTVDTNLVDSTDETTAHNSSDSAQSVQPAQNLKLIETVNFDISATAIDTTKTTKRAQQNQKVALNNGTISLTIKKSELGTTAQLELKPKSGYRVAKVEIYDEEGKEVNYIIDDNGLFNILIPKGQLSVDVKFDFVLPEVATFDDIPSGHSNALAIEHLFAEKIMIGVADKFFDEAAALNRAMIIKILHNMTGNPPVDVALTFEDISIDAWYYQALQWSFKNGIAKGYSNKQFAPLKVVNKEEFLVFLYRYHIKDAAVKDEHFDLSIYRDSADISDYAKTAFKWALDNQLIEASQTGELTPKVVIDRAAAAEIIHRYLSIR